MVRPFLILSLPRSRSYWLSRVLSYGGREVDHDPSRFFTGVGDAARYLTRPDLAACDTGMCRMWGTLNQYVPDDVLVIVIHRSVVDVTRSVLRCLPEPPESSENLARAIHHCAIRLWHIPGLHIKYEDLSIPETGEALFRLCLGKPLDRAWWEEMDKRNLQCDIAQNCRDAADNAAGWRQLLDDARPVS